MASYSNGKSGGGSSLPSEKMARAASGKRLRGGSPPDGRRVERLEGSIRMAAFHERHGVQTFRRIRMSQRADQPKDVRRDVDAEHTVASIFRHCDRLLTSGLLRLSLG
jgi:hypothetical protein